jgi:hypothetical protein
VSEIWITFPDPQMKKVNKRLTSTRFLDNYRHILCDGGTVHLKTDSPFLYTYTHALVEENHLPVTADTDDLYASGMADDILDIKTHYEMQWLQRGLTIKYIRFALPHGVELVEPDIEIEPEYMSNLAIALVQKLLIFDYATDFYRKHKEIAPAETFEITDEIYNDFCRYLKDKKLSYNTVTERVIKELRDVAKQEKYDSAIEQQLKEMESRLATEKESDLQKHREEVCEMLKAEILTRYYYDQGRLQGALKSDKAVLRAVEELCGKGVKGE